MSISGRSLEVCQIQQASVPHLGLHASELTAHEMKRKTLKRGKLMPWVTIGHAYGATLVQQGRIC